MDELESDLGFEDNNVSDVFTYADYWWHVKISGNVFELFTSHGLYIFCSYISSYWG